MAYGRGSIHDPQIRQVLAEKPRKIWFEPLAAAAGWFKTAVTYAAGANKTVTTTSFTAAYCPGWPVAPVIFVSEDTGDTFSAVSSVVIGFDQFGDWKTETVAHTNSSGDWTGTCVNAYEKLLSVATTVTGTTTTSDDVVIGFAKTYGLGTRITATDEVIAKLFNGVAEAGTVSVTNNTYVMVGTPDAAKILALYIKPKYFFRG